MTNYEQKEKAWYKNRNFFIKHFYIKKLWVFFQEFRHKWVCVCIMYMYDILFWLSHYSVKHLK